MTVARKSIFASAAGHAQFIDVADGVDVANQVLTGGAPADKAVADEAQIALAARLVRIFFAIGIDVASHIGAGTSLRPASDAVADESVVADTTR